jgi:hypothetical protein
MSESKEKRMARRRGGLDIFEYVRNWLAWTPQDETSQAKFRIETAEAFGVPIERVDGVIAAVRDERK